ncbi:hypothetical protein D3C80_1637700 [compost metagenome]
MQLKGRITIVLASLGGFSCTKYSYVVQMLISAAFKCTKYSYSTVRGLSVAECAIEMPFFVREKQSIVFHAADLASRRINVPIEPFLLHKIQQKLLTGRNLSKRLYKMQSQCRRGGRCGRRGRCGR